MFGTVISFFKSLGHLLGKALHLIHDLVPEAYLVKGVELVKEAALKFADNADRRAWVASELVALFHIPDHVANLIVELAVGLVKKEAVVLITDAAAAAGV